MWKLFITMNSLPVESWKVTSCGNLRHLLNGCVVQLVFDSQLYFELGVLGIFYGEGLSDGLVGGGG